MGRDIACDWVRCDHCDDEWGPFQVCSMPQPTFGVRSIVNGFHPLPPSDSCEQYTYNAYPGPLELMQL